MYHTESLKAPQFHDLMRSEVVPKSFAMLLKKCGLLRGASASSRDQQDSRALGAGVFFLVSWSSEGLAASVWICIACYHKQRDRVGEVGGSCRYMLLNLWGFCCCCCCCCCCCYCCCFSFASYSGGCLNLPSLQDLLVQNGTCTWIVCFWEALMIECLEQRISPGSQLADRLTVRTLQLLKVDVWVKSIQQ